jgi:hypothetical protein
MPEMYNSIKHLIILVTGEGNFSREGGFVPATVTILAANDRDMLNKGHKSGIECVSAKSAYATPDRYGVYANLTILSCYCILLRHCASKVTQSVRRNLQIIISNKYRVSQNSRIPNSERGRERPSGARKILRKKKLALPEEDISTLILFNT